MTPDEIMAREYRSRKDKLFAIREKLQTHPDMYARNPTELAKLLIELTEMLIITQTELESIWLREQARRKT